MGVLLSTPLTEKDTQVGAFGKFNYVSCSMQGWRKTMEDAHIAQSIENKGSIFGVYDGHGGREVAKFVELHLVEELIKTESFQAGDYAKSLIETYMTLDKKLDSKDTKLELHDLSEKSNSDDTNTNDLLSRIASLIENSQDQKISLSRLNPVEPQDNTESPDIQKAKEIIDEQEKQEQEIDVNFVRCGIYSGTTAVTALITENQIIVANSGDSRCILSRGGQVVEMSHDHKPSNKEECARIYKAGGYVQNARVNGDLALSRAIGDTQHKCNKDLPPEEQAVTAYPDVKIVNRTPEDEFLVIACDGIWDVKSNEEVLAFVKNGLEQGLSLNSIAESLLDSCLAKEPTGLGTDNMTVVIVTNI
jgi:protein phosphatase 1G